MPKGVQEFAQVFHQCVKVKHEACLHSTNWKKETNSSRATQELRRLFRVMSVGLIAFRKQRFNIPQPMSRAITDVQLCCVSLVNPS